jgi:hypothetical protein
VSEDGVFEDDADDSAGAADYINQSNISNTQIAAAGGLRCDGFPSGCQSGGTYGTSAMYHIDGRNLCTDCAVKYFCLQDEPTAEKVRILNPFIIGK